MQTCTYVFNAYSLWAIACSGTWWFSFMPSFSDSKTYSRSSHFLSHMFKIILLKSEKEDLKNITVPPHQRGGVQLTGEQLPFKEHPLTSSHT